MAAPKKRRRADQQNSDSSDSDEQHGEQNENENEIEMSSDMEMIDIDLDVRYPEEGDKDGIKRLLKQLFLKAHVNLSELADLLIKQDSITGIVKQTIESDDEEDLESDDDVNFGVFSVVNLTWKKNMECIKQISSYILNNCKSVCEKSKFEQVKKILADDQHHVGFIISERLINIPPKIAVPLYSGLSNDMSKAKEKKEPFDFSYYVIICKIVVFEEGPGGENVIYTNAEEELIAEVATLSFDFSVAQDQGAVLSGEWTSDDTEGCPKRRVLFFSASQWDEMYNKLEQELGASAINA